MSAHLYGGYTRYDEQRHSNEYWEPTPAPPTGMAPPPPAVPAPPAVYSEATMHRGRNLATIVTCYSDIDAGRDAVQRVAAALADFTAEEIEAARSVLSPLLQLVIWAAEGIRDKSRARDAAYSPEDAEVVASASR